MYGDHVDRYTRDKLKMNSQQFYSPEPSAQQPVYNSAPMPVVEKPLEYYYQKKQDEDWKDNINQKINILIALVIILMIIIAVFLMIFIPVTIRDTLTRIQ